MFGRAVRFQGHLVGGNVTDHRHGHALKPTTPLPDGHDIQQSLGGMLVWTVASVDHVAVEIISLKMTAKKS